MSVDLARLSLGLVGAVLLLGSPTVQGESPPRSTSEFPSAKMSRAQPAAPWETFSKGTYEHRGLARVERVGARWVLTVFCDGTHSVYIDTATKADLRAYTTQFVRARYIYVDRLMKDPRCFKEPCDPVVERRIILKHVHRERASEDEARQLARQCGEPKGGRE